MCIRDRACIGNHVIEVLFIVHAGRRNDIDGAGCFFCLSCSLIAFIAGARDNRGIGQGFYAVKRFCERIGNGAVIIDGGVAVLGSCNALQLNGLASPCVVCQNIRNGDWETIVCLLYTSRCV